MNIVIVLAIAAALVAPTLGAAAQPRLTVATLGGSYQDQVSEAWLKPVATRLGARLTLDTAATSAELRAHVEGGQRNWDVVLLAGSSCEAARREGLVQPLDYAVIDAAGVPPAMRKDAYVGVLQYATMLVWNGRQFGGKAPSSWADLFDVARFPGPRALDARPTFTLEIALLADGVPPDRLYPLDVDRAFRKLEQLKPHVAVYYANGAVASQLLKDEEVVMMPLYENRVYALRREGVPQGATLNGAILDINCMMIPRGAQQADLSMQLIAGVVDPAVNARIALASDMAPANALAFETGQISPERRRELSSAPENMPQQIVFNAEWWAPRLAEITQRYKAFISK